MKHERDEPLLIELQTKHPKKEYKISVNGIVVRRWGKSWKPVCKHNRAKTTCSVPECDGGGSNCIHGIKRSTCPKEECNGGGSLCKLHKIRSSFCPDPRCKGGGGLCKKHKKIRSFCLDPDCDGGGSYCEHGCKRSHCKFDECKGGGSLCVHKIFRSYCRDPDCGGGGAYCKHNILRVHCNDEECDGGGCLCQHGIKRSTCSDIECGGGSALCKICREKTRAIDGYCTTCHPDYIPTVVGASKIGCQFICALQKQLGITIQHLHYDKVSKSVTGSEFTLPENKRKKVDGYYVDPTTGQKVAIEFLGNIYHGHPSLWGQDEQNCNYFGIRYKDAFERTEQMMVKVAGFGYTLRYVWESDYQNLGVFQSPLTILREFKGRLKH